MARRKACGKTGAPPFGTHAALSSNRDRAPVVEGPSTLSAVARNRPRNGPFRLGGGRSDPGKSRGRLIR